MNRSLTPTHAVPRARSVPSPTWRLRPAAWGVCACALLLGVRVLAEGVAAGVDVDVGVWAGAWAGARAVVPLAEVVEALPFL